MPVHEEYYPTEHTIYNARWQLGFFHFSIHLVDSKGTLNPQVHEMVGEINPVLGRRYVCMLTIGNSSWLWHSTDSLVEAEVEYKKVLKALKEGDNFVFDDFGEPKTRSIRLSWRGIEVEW